MCRRKPSKVAQQKGRNQSVYATENEQIPLGKYVIREGIPLLLPKQSIFPERAPGIVTENSKQQQNN